MLPGVVSKLGPGGEVGAEPGQSSLAQAGALLGLERRDVFVVAAAGKHREVSCGVPRPGLQIIG